MQFLIYKDQQHQWRWTLYAANHRKLANCGEGYHNKADCLHDLNLVANSAAGDGTPIKYAA